VQSLVYLVTLVVWTAVTLAVITRGEREWDHWYDFLVSLLDLPPIAVVQEEVEVTPSNVPTVDYLAVRRDQGPSARIPCQADGLARGHAVAFDLN